MTIVTPDHWHAYMAILAAKKGKDIYCEKPLALTIGQGRAIVDAVNKYNVVFQTGSHERSNPNVQQACQLVLDGKIGEVKRVITHVGKHNKVGPGPGWKPTAIPDGFDYDMWLGPAPKVPYHKDRCLYRFRFNYDYAGGQIANFGAHSNDMAQWGLGMDSSGPVEVECLEREFLPEGSLFNAATFTKFRCRYESGVELICQTATPSVQVRFEGTKGSVQVQNKGAKLKTEPDSLVKSRVSDRDIKLKHDTDHQRNFLDCVKSRETPIASAEIGHRSATVCHLGNIAVRLGTKLQWDPVNEKFINNEKANSMLFVEMRDPWKMAELQAPVLLSSTN
ncbi:MAG: Gfo/Idh/MocA family oxidoreductase [Planctomycetota bacterium]